MLTARRRIDRKLSPLGWCMEGHHEGLAETEAETEMLSRGSGLKLSRCPGKVTLSGGTLTGKEMFCICTCHGERQLPEWQIKYMADLEAKAAAAPPVVDPDAEELGEVQEAPPSASETPTTAPEGRISEGAEVPGETLPGVVDQPVPDGADRPEGEVAEWTSSRTKPMPIPGGFIERVTFPSPTKPEIRVVGWVAYNDSMVRLARVWQRQQAKDLCARGLKPGDE